MTRAEKYGRKIEIINGEKSIIGKILFVEKACLVIELNNDITMKPEVIVYTMPL